MDNDELKKASEFEQEIDKSSTLDELNEVRIKYMGKKGIISLLNKVLGTLSPEERPKMGESIQNLRNKFEEKFNEKTARIKKALKDMAISQEYIDVTLSPYPFNKGSLHPVKKIYDEIVDVFTAAGYMVAQGPEIEDDFHNFEALNLPKSHPARDMQDTFYIDENNIVLRTHTSPVQVRVMESQKPPIKIIAPGAVYRCDYDQTHSPMFHQIEGLVVDKGITMADLKGTLKLFISRVFGDDLDVRLRPSFFPFTELIGKNDALPKLLALKYSINFFASCSVSVTIFCKLAPNAISIAVSYSFGTAIKFAITPYIPLFNSLFFSQSNNNCFTLFI